MKILNEKDQVIAECSEGLSVKGLVELQNSILDDVGLNVGFLFQDTESVYIIFADVVTNQFKTEKRPVVEAYLKGYFSK